VICEAAGTQPMAKDADGVWSVTVGPVPPGIYDCQFAWVGAFSAAVSGNDPALAVLRSDPVAANQKLKLLWIAIGKDDFLLARNRDFVKALDELKIRHSSQETERTHAWGVWRGYLAEFLPLLFR
jgi:enterochelin esterase family protein